MLEAILSFPIPRTLTDARSWFGLINQVAWVYSLGPVMLPFCDLVKRDSHFVWDKSLEDAFEHSKKVIVDLVKKGISHIRKKSSNLPRPRLEQRGNRLPTTAKILHVHDWQGSNLLPWRLAPYICQQQILHWCQTQICTYRGWDNPPAILQELLNGFPTEPSQLDIIAFDDMDDWVKLTTLLSSFGSNDNVALISPDTIRAAEHNDLQYKKLIDTIQNGFEKTRSLTAPEIRDYWEVRHGLSVDDGLVLLDHRIVIPTSQRANVLCSLHSAHQGEVDMKARTNESVYWPGMSA